MSIHATGFFDAKSWGEQPYDERDGVKLTRGSMVNAFRGDIEGEGTVETLMAYSDDQSANFVGLERIVGRIGDRSGSFVLQHSGTFDLARGAAKATWIVVSGSGTGDLRGLRGEGGYEWDRQRDGQSTPFTLDYDFNEKGEQR